MIQLIQWLSNRSMPTTITGIEYYEEPDYKEHWVRDAAISTRTLSVDWSRREQFRMDMLGYTRLSGTHMMRFVPDQHPDATHLWCDEIQLINAYGASKPTQDAQGKIVFDRAIYLATYRAPKWIVKSDQEVESETVRELARYVEKRYKFSTTNLTLSGGGYCWASDHSKIVTTTGTKTIMVLELHYTWKQLPKIPWVAIGRNAGKSNSGTFEGLYPVETVLFENILDITPYFTAAGDFVYDLTYLFKVRLNQDPSNNTLTWNQVPRADGVNFENIVSVTDFTTKLYPPSDLGELFSFALDG